MQKTMRSLIAIAAVVLAHSAAHASENLDIQVSSGGTTTSRQLNYYAPAGLNHPPLVIVMHGAGGDGNNLAEAWGWNTIAEREKILVVTPFGVDRKWVIWGNDDVDFIKAIIEEMASRYNIDRNRVYATGWSMGGMMSYYLACHAPGLIAAIGPSSGYLLYGQSDCTGERNVPIHHIHGLWDGTVGYDGLHGYLNDNWIGPFGCPTTADESNAGTKSDPNAPGDTKREYWGPCQRDGKTSEIYLDTFSKPHIYGTDETEVFWNFFKNYALNETILGVAIFQHGDFRGRMNRLVKGDYPHALLNAVGIPDGVVTSIQVDPGLKVELFDNDNFQNPLATYQDSVANLSAINTQVTALRISNASGGTGGTGNTGVNGSSGNTGVNGSSGNTGVNGSGSALGSGGSSNGAAGDSSAIVDSTTGADSSNGCDCALGGANSKHRDTAAVALGLVLAALVRKRRGTKPGRGGTA